MALLPLVVFALLQGAVVLLPLSAPAHGTLASLLTSWPTPGPAFDIAVSLGTLAAVLVYCRDDVRAIASGAWRKMRRRRSVGGRVEAALRLAGCLVLGAMPLSLAIVAAPALGWSPGPLTLPVLGWSSVGIALALWAADSLNMTVKRVEHLSWTDALVIGAVVALAVFPGAGRGALAIGAARFLGCERRAALRFSALISIPLLGLVGSVAMARLIADGAPVAPAPFLLAGAVAFAGGWAALEILTRWLRRHTYAPFVLYQVGVGAAALGVAYGLPFARDALTRLV
ncbi:undecaprenyl-diphosphate phosphatase [Pararhodospirillum oryzae]|uniref:undecaprenyl-diphosphate phosphatase n=1 Tax=Pararhodospirillum oryzae TaxID=478448 RepID=UPI001478462A|nr:undecaprenyl-diphosphate phosphatase [Pararhodospirillum oryzae]